MIEFRQNTPLGRVENAAALSRSLGVPMELAELLCRRGFEEPEAAKDFLTPSLQQLHDPFLFAEMRQAVDAVFSAMAEDRLICVFGDYDVDGIMAVTILVRYLKSVGARVTHYIPQRHTEGYGLNKAAIDGLFEQGVSLLITVDCGITAIEEINYAKELGIDVVVTDHHQCLKELPDCLAVVDPANPADPYPYRHLCGAGVAFKFVQAMGGLTEAKQYIDCACLATLADIVPLTGENRAIVAKGLKAINSGNCLAGIKAMIEVSGYLGRTVEAGAVSFAIAPRINAAGRTGTAETALSLFLTDDEKKAQKLAAELDNENRRRQAIEGEIFKDAMDRIARGEADIVRDPAIILVGEGWNHGVIGIVASRLVERYTRPVLLFTCEDGLCVGSGRSVKGVHLFDSLNAMSDLFIRFGGHEMAAGLTIEQSKMQEFCQRFIEHLKKTAPKDAFVPRANYDMTLPPERLSLKLAEAIKRMAPFGTGNPAPIFRVAGVSPRNPVTMGNENRHLRFTLSRGRDVLGCVAFGMGDKQEALTDIKAELLCSLEINDFRGVKKEQLVIRNIRAMLPVDTDGYIKNCEYKFHDAFFALARYNSDCRKPEGSAALCIEERSDWAERFAKWVEDSPQGAAAVCVTPQGAKDFLSSMRERGIADKLDVLFGETLDERAHNAVIMAPMPLPLEGFRKVLFMEKLPAPLCVALAFGADEEVITAGMSLRAFSEQAKVGRDELIPVYEAMNRLAVAKTVFLSRTAYLEELKKLCSSPMEHLIFGLHVFSELGFFRSENVGAFRVTAVKDSIRRLLSESPTFAAVNRGMQ
ncbi:MAG: single-stranded-DNA-specific exonuclease RecJ [Christensenellales bacterium]|jgi:single-stranded-DNA-specific exonuclease